MEGRKQDTANSNWRQKVNPAIGATDTGIITVERLNPGIRGLILSFGEWEDRVIIQGVNFDPEPQMNIVVFNGIDAIVRAQQRLFF